jgi:hypothetical protein
VKETRNIHTILTGKASWKETGLCLDPIQIGCDDEYWTQLASRQSNGSLYTCSNSVTAEWLSSLLGSTTQLAEFPILSLTSC